MTINGQDISSLLGELEEAAGPAALHNAQAIAGIYSQVREVTQAAGITSRELGEALGVSASDADAMLHGEIDLTLTDLELILAAIDAKIHVKVAPAKVSVEVRQGGRPEWVSRKVSSTAGGWREAPKSSFVGT